MFHFKNKKLNLSHWRTDKNFFVVDDWPSAVAGVHIARGVSILWHLVQPKLRTLHTSSITVFGHIYCAVIAERLSLAMDHEVFLACVLHDLGLTHTYAGIFRSRFRVPKQRVQYSRKAATTL